MKVIILHSNLRTAACNLLVVIPIADSKFCSLTFAMDIRKVALLIGTLRTIMALLFAFVL